MAAAQFRASAPFLQERDQEHAQFMVVEGADRARQRAAAFNGIRRLLWLAFAAAGPGMEHLQDLSFASAPNGGPHYAPALIPTIVEKCFIACSQARHGC